MLTVPNSNHVDNIIQTREFVTKTYLEDLTALPRTNAKLKPLNRAKTPWDFKKSVFRDYINDNEAILT